MIKKILHFMIFSLLVPMSYLVASSTNEPSTSVVATNEPLPDWLFDPTASMPTPPPPPPPPPLPQITPELLAVQLATLPTAGQMQVLSALSSTTIENFLKSLSQAEITDLLSQLNPDTLLSSLNPTTVFGSLVQMTQAALPTSSDTAVQGYITGWQTALNNLQQLVVETQKATAFNGTQLGSQLNSYLRYQFVTLTSLVTPGTSTGSTQASGKGPITLNPNSILSQLPINGLRQQGSIPSTVPKGPSSSSQQISSQSSQQIQSATE